MYLYLFKLILEFIDIPTNILFDYLIFDLTLMKILQFYFEIRWLRATVKRGMEKPNFCEQRVCMLASQILFVINVDQVSC